MVYHWVSLWKSTSSEQGKHYVPVYLNIPATVGTCTSCVLADECCVSVYEVWVICKWSEPCYTKNVLIVHN